MAQNDYAAVVVQVEEIADRKQTIHAWMEPGGKKTFMRFPHVVLAESDGTSAMLYRYRIDGGFCGDTWHASLSEAQHQAEYEYGPALGPWSSVPRDVANAHQHALRFLRRCQA